jgi:hypothetical protein
MWKEVGTKRKKPEKNGKNRKKVAKPRKKVKKFWQIYLLFCLWGPSYGGSGEYPPLPPLIATSLLNVEPQQNFHLFLWTEERFLDWTIRNRRNNSANE